MTMGIANILVCLTFCALLATASDPVSVNGLSEVTRPTSPVSVNGLSDVPSPTGDTISEYSLSYIPGPFDSWATESAAPTFASASGSSDNHKGKIAGGVVGGLAVVIATVGAIVYLRLRGNRSTTHWRNRATGAWQDQEGKAGGPIYVGQPLDHPLDGYSPDLKVHVAAPATTAAVFIREPRLAYPFSASHRGHTSGPSSFQNSNNSMEMHETRDSPTSRF
ncbi:hypothetical protein B0H12DRAFT_321865 [Mycena haematopus]|nr:hypothetical protein B0H12DRAFT_321865 [Mycena haematopus]